MKAENDTNQVDNTRRLTSVSSRETCNSHQPGMLKTLGIQLSNKFSKSRATEITKLLAKIFHHNALPFDLVESDELSDFIKT